MSVVTLTFYDEDDPLGTPLGTLTDADFITSAGGPSFAVRDALWEMPSAVFTISKHHSAVASGLVSDNNYVTVTFPIIDSDPVFGFWLRDVKAALVAAEEEGGEYVTFGGPGVLGGLQDIRLGTSSSVSDQPARGSADHPGVWWWLNEPYGAILTRTMEEGRHSPFPDPAAAGSPLEYYTIDFDRVNDSNSDPWPNIDDEFEVSIGMDGLSVMEQLRDAGDLYVIGHPDLLVQCFNSYGTNRASATFGAGKVRFVKGTNILTELTREGHTRKEGNKLILRDSDGNFSTETLSGYSSANREHWLYFEAEQTNDDGLLNKIGQEVLGASNTEPEDIQFEVAPGQNESTGLYLPWKHYKVGDTVTLHTGTGLLDYNNAAYKIVAFRVELDEAARDDTTLTSERSLHVVVELNHRTRASGTIVPRFTPKPPNPGSPGGCFRLYFSNSVGTPAPTADGSWEDDSSGGTMRQLKTTADATYSSTNAFTTSTGGMAGGRDCLLWRGVIQLDTTTAAILAAGGATVRAQMRARARFGIGISESSQDMISQIGIRVTTGNSTTIRGTALSLHSAASSAGATKWPAQSTKVNRVAPPASQTNVLSAVSGAASGDYMVVELGVRNFTTVTSGASIALTNDNGTDLPEDELETAALNSWIEFCTADTVGDVPEPIGLPGEETFGDDCLGTYATKCHVHAHGTLADDDVHLHDADQNAYDNTTSGLSANTVQAAIDELATGAAAGVVTDHGTMGATEDFDATDSEDHEGVIDQNLTITLSGATDGEPAWLTLKLTDDGGGPSTILWPAEVAWPGGVEPDPPGAGETLIVSLFSYDGGTNWYGAYPGTSSSLTVKDDDGGVVVAPTETLSFEADEFTVTDEGGGVAKVSLVSAGGGTSQHILLADGRGTPFTFDDMLQMDDGSDFMWSDPE